MAEQEHCADPIDMEALAELDKKGFKKLLAAQSQGDGPAEPEAGKA